MKNLFGIMFTFAGLFLVGVGAFIGFENYNREFFSKENDFLYNGVYFASSDIVSVEEKDNETLTVQINQEPYIFVNDGEKFVNEETGFYIIFSADKLTIYKDNKIIKSLNRKYKNSIQN